MLQVDAHNAISVRGLCFLLQLLSIAEDKMSQAITTKFLGPTDFRGSRVKATASAGSATVSWDHSKDIEDNHRAAAEELCRRLDWSYKTLACGELPRGVGNVYVLVR